MKLKMIAAVGRNNELGKNNDLLWHLPEDLKFFKETTIGKTVVMGKSTFDSLPKVLPNRKNIVLAIGNFTFPEGVIVYDDANKFLSDYKDSNEEIFVIGGGTIYKLFIDKADEIYLTEIDAEDKEATVFFPEFDKEKYDREVISSHEQNDISYKHVLYRRK